MFSYNVTVFTWCLIVRVCWPRLSLIGLRLLIFLRSAISIVFRSIPQVLVKYFLQTWCFWPLTFRVNVLAICFRFLLGNPIVSLTSTCATMKSLCLSYDCKFQYELKMSNRSSSLNLLLHLNLHFSHESGPRVLAGTVFPYTVVYSCPL